MWPFTKGVGRRGNWLSPIQAQQAVKIYYADLDEGCWFAAAFVSEDEIVRLSARSKQDAIETAQFLADEVFAKSGRRIPIHEGRRGS